MPFLSSAASKAGESTKPGKRKNFEFLAARGLVDRRDARVDVGQSLLQRQVAQVGMAVGMAPDRVALGDFAAHEARHAGGVAADQEEGRLGALRGERVEHARRGGGGAVVEGQDDLVILEIERLRIGFQPEMRRAADGDGAGDAQSLGTAMIRLAAAPVSAPRRAERSQQQSTRQGRGD